MSKATCNSCGKGFTYEPNMLYGRELFRPKRCFRCAEKEMAQLAEHNEQLRLRTEWAVICPPDYRETDPCHPDMDQALLAALLKWTPDQNRGIGLYGMAGKRKTRMLYLLLSKLHFEGHRCMAVTATELSEAFYKCFRDDASGDRAAALLLKCKSAYVLLIDDLGKQKFTEAGEAAFYDLLEYRAKHRKRLLWTANSTPEDIVSRLSADRAPAIFRRLTEEFQLKEL